MALMNKLTLRGKISLLALASLLVGLGLFSWLGVQSVNDSVDRMLDERLTVARIVATHLDEALLYILVQLQSIDVFGDELPSEERFDLLAVSLQDLFTKSRIHMRNILLVDPAGEAIRVGPESSRAVSFDIADYPEVAATLATGTPGISGLVPDPLQEAPVVLVSTPILNSDHEVVAALICSIDIEQSSIGVFSETISIGKTGYTEIVDGNGIVLARNKPGSPAKLFERSDHPGRFAELIIQGEATVGTCHRCHGAEGEEERERDVLAFAPLSVASWGVAIRQSEEEALSPTRQLEQRFLILGVILLGCTLLVVWAMMQGIVKPIRMLTSAAKKVAVSDFEASIPLQRGDEIGQLSAAFHTMRQEIARSRDEMLLRYEEAKEREELRGQLLSRVISAQEEERKRIARELHDEYGQTLTGLIMSIESLENMVTPQQPQFQEKLADTKSLLFRALEDIRRLTVELRPSLLDDLGLVAAIRAHIRGYIEDAGINVQFDSNGVNQRLSPVIETALFRIIQEATHNVIKHAQASNIDIKLETRDSNIAVTVADDGCGFDVDAFFRARTETKSLGILGIQERTALLGGVFSVKSNVGQGTSLRVEIPLSYSASLDDGFDVQSGQPEN